MKDNPLNNGNCPAVNQISAYFDGELKNPEEFEAHLKNCPVCREYYDSIVKMDYCMKHIVHQTGSEEEIAKRILSGVKSSIKTDRKKTSRKFFLSPVQWRAASLVFIGAALGYFLWDEYKSEQEVYLPKRIAKSAEVPAVISAVPKSSVQLSDFSRVKFSSGDHEESLDPSQKYVPIREYIRHVWSVDSDPAEKLSVLLNECGLPDDSLKKLDNKWSISCKSEKIRIIRFVNGCHTAGFRLLSPDQPQPEQQKFSGRTDDIVYYSADFTGKR